MNAQPHSPSPREVGKKPAAHPHNRIHAVGSRNQLTAQPEGFSPLALWHLLSLDAPTIATLWTYFIARATRVTLSFASLAAMFLVVWMLYCADRLLDARNSSRLEMRHRFHATHGRAFTLAFMAAAIAFAFSVPYLQHAALRLYATLGTMLAVWLLLIHTRPATSHRLPKELAVAIFFPAAVFIPTVARQPQLRAVLLLPAILFAAVCALNCLYLYRWEHPHTAAEAHSSTRLGLHNLRPLTLAIIAIATLAALLEPAGARALPAAIALAAAALLLLHANRQRFSAVHLRTLADAALLTPLLFLLR